MKKLFFVMFVAIATTLSFSSCGAGEEELTLADIAGYTFAGEDGSDTYELIFDASGNTFTFNSVVSGASGEYTGTWSISGLEVILDYGGGLTETLGSDGTKTLIYDITIELKRK